MVRCPSCQREVVAGAKFCGECGAPVDLTSAPTLDVAPSPPPTSDPSAGGRFLPGAMLAGRYRIVGLLGRGGMGEVYRADDLRLGQPVALKFLPASLARDTGRLERFHNEVKLARQVSHTAVCRVYDVGEADGHQYLSMEYVDGEDLASLLRRIGRLPEDKAVQIARQLCAGLAAAHDQGILHRDLKPANVLIDGRGRAKVTDFGLASLGESVTGVEAGAGTPAYMAPEQLAGQEATPRSDVYALGLVLYELFTGKRAFEAKSAAELRRLQEQSSPSSPSSHLTSLDPAVERVILRCLERDPRERPASPLAVAAALPGGDPLAAALAAGETPSPEMVADAGAVGGLSPRLGAPLLALILLFIGALAHFSQARLDHWPLPKPPEDMILRARQLIDTLGYSGQAADREYFLDASSRLARHLEERYDAGDRSLEPMTVVPAPIAFAYRQSPEALIAWRTRGFVLWSEPPFVVPGMVRLRLDASGRLIEFEAVPPEHDDTDSVAPEPDWGVLLGEAGLDLAVMREASPAWTFPTESDVRRAWTGAYAQQPEVPIRVEGRSYRGRVTGFRVVPPWITPRESGAADQGGAMESARRVVGQLVFFSMFVGAAILAWRNLRSGRADRRGAFRLGAIAFLFDTAFWLLSAHHSPSRWSELLFARFGDQLFVAAQVWLFYLAMEPYARRLLPEALISWSRLLTGRLRDPRVGRDLLIGASTGLFLLVVHDLGRSIEIAQGVTPAWVAAPEQIGIWIRLRLTVGLLFDLVPAALSVPLAMIVILMLLRVLLRRQKVALVVLFAVLTFLNTGVLDSPAVAWPFGLMAATLILGVLTRFGLLATCFLFLYVGLGSTAGLTTDLGAWYGTGTVVVAGVMAAAAAYGFYISLAGRPLLAEPPAHTP